MNKIEKEIEKLTKLNKNKTAILKITNELVEEMKKLAESDLLIQKIEYGDTDLDYYSILHEFGKNVYLLNLVNDLKVKKTETILNN